MIEQLKELLTTLVSVGIEEVVIENPKDEDEKLSLIRGSNAASNVIVFHEVDAVFFETAPMGTHTVKGLLSRLELFDIAKTQISHTERGDVIHNLTIKQGRKKASFTCSNPRNLTIPSRVPEFDMKTKYTLNEDVIDVLNSAITAMSMTGSKVDRYISASVQDGVLSVNIFDGEDDSFSDEFILEDEPEDSPSGSFSWDVPSFQRVMRESERANDGVAVFNISKHGIAIFDVGIVNVLLPPNRSGK